MTMKYPIQQIDVLTAEYSKHKAMSNLENGM